MPVQHRARSSSDPFGDPSLPALSHKAAPPVPPKASPPRPTHHRDNTMEAIKDTVTVRNHEPTSARLRVGRSQTQVTPQAGSNTRTRRSVSQDSATKPVSADKGKKPRSKKGSSHADVIDRLDFSGVGPMFHHDGPFDACAPSRNRLRTKAPMAAWSAAPDGGPVPPPRQEYRPPPPLPQTYMPEPAPKKKVDAIAEAWGIHEPEPFEDFSAGGGQNEYKYSPASTISRSSNHVEESRPARRQPIRKNTLPPPQPIFVPEPEEDASSPPSPPLPGSPGMKRSKSLMHRIRKMRETPNVPVNNGDTINEGYGSPPSPNEATNGSTRPTHRSQNSFLGRFGRTGNGNGNGREYPGSPEEPYTYANDPKDKELPRPPQDNGENGPATYFSSTHGSSGGPPSGGGGLGRKQSLLKKVGKAVKGI